MEEILKYRKVSLCFSSLSVSSMIDLEISRIGLVKFLSLVAREKKIVQILISYLLKRNEIIRLCLGV